MDTMPKWLWDEACKRANQRHAECRDVDVLACAIGVLAEGVKPPVTGEDLHPVRQLPLHIRPQTTRRLPRLRLLTLTRTTPAYIAMALNRRLSGSGGRLTSASLSS